MARTAVAQFQNLVTKSQNAADALWTKSGLNASTPIVSNDAIGPDGTMTADRLVEDNSTAFHTVFRNTGAVIAPGVYTVSASLKEGTRRYGGVQIIVGTGLQRYFVLLDLRTGTVLGTSSTGSPTSTAYSVVSEGNGWYRLSVTALNPNVAAVYVCVAPSDSASPSYSASFPSYTGDNSSGIYATDYQVVCANWGGPKVKTTTTAVDTGNIRSVVAQSQNILPYSQNLDTWTASGCSITANTTDTLDPWGTNTAEILVEDSSTGTHRMQTIGGAQNIVIGSPLTVSVFVKAGTRSECYIQNSVGENMTVNLATGAIDAFTGGINRGVINAGNGWWRLWISFLAPATNASLYVYAGNPALSYTGTNLSKALYVAGAQYTRTNWLTPYVQTGASILDVGNLRNVATRNAVAQKQNLVTYSSDISNGAWTKTLSSISGTDGIIGTAALNTHSIQQAKTFITGATYTISASLKAGAQSYGTLGDNSGGRIAWFNLANGTTGTATNSTSKIKSDPNNAGYYICEVTFVAVAGSDAVCIYPSSANGVATFTGDGATVDMYAKSIQLVQANWKGPTTETTAAAVNTGNIRNLVL